MRDPVDTGRFFGVELHFLVQRTAQGVQHAAFDRAPQRLRIDDEPAVVRAHEPLHEDTAGAAIHLHFGDLCDHRLIAVAVRHPTGGASAPNASAAAWTTAIERAALNPVSSLVSAVSMRRRNSTGSALAAAASSSMNDSAGKVICGPVGSRRLPVLK